MKVLLSLFLLNFIQTKPLFAKEITVRSTTLSDLSDVHYGNTSPEVPLSATMRSLIYVRGSCYPIDLPGVSSPLLGVSTSLKDFSTDIYLKLYITANDSHSLLTLRIPGSLVSDQGTTHTTHQGTTIPINNSQVSAIIVKTPANTPANTSSRIFASSKKISSNTAGFQFDNQKIDKVHSVHLSQGTRTSQLTLKGEPSIYFQYNPEPQSSVLKINFAVPVAKGVPGCGAYYSPLMVFFNKKRPSFKNVSNFPLVKNASVHWPEKNAPGYFLVLDRNKDGKITKASELFRNSDKHASGFKHLATLDSNKDGLIDKDDKIFSKLQLWNDKNANGISEKSELFSFKDKQLYYISLKSKNIEQNYGNRAKAVQRSFFTYKNHKGNFAKSEIVDLWFSVARPKVYKSNKTLSLLK